MTTVVHCKKDKYDIYIGRPSKWGDPFILGRDGDRKEVILRYKQWIFLPENAELLKQAKIKLKDQILGCWCSPLACHGDILCEIIDNNIGGLCGLCNGRGCVGPYGACNGNGYSGT